MTTQINKRTIFFTIRMKIKLTCSLQRRIGVGTGIKEQKQKFKKLYTVRQVVITLISINALLYKGTKITLTIKIVMTIKLRENMKQRL